MRYFIALVAMCACLVLGAGAALAQSVGKQAPGGDLLRAGESALAKGQYKVAARNFTKAMQSGDLTNVQVAKALYQRGIANEKTGRPADAIADITNALFIEGLAGADRAKAYLGRARAYEAVGMNKLALSDKSRAGSGGASEQRIASSNKPVSSELGGADFSTSVHLPDSRTPAPIFRTKVKMHKSTPQPQKVVTFETKSRPRQDNIPRFRTTIVPRESKAPASPASAPKTRASRTTQRVALARPAVSSLSSSFAATLATPRPQTSSVPRPPAPRTAAGGSGYRIQIAALRSDAEAQATWKRLVKKHRKLLAGHQPNIVRTELGGLGTFYRLQLGPFAEKEPSKQLCKEFKLGGLDCFLLAP